MKNHKSAFICAFLIGAIIAASQIYFRLQHQDYGMSLGGSDESAYLSRIQEVRDGHYTTASYVWREGKDLPYLIPPLSEIVTDSIGRIFNLNIVDTTTLGRFLFPAIVFLLIYALLYQLIKKKLAALTISATVLLSTDLVGPSVLLNFIFKRIPPSYNFLTFHRLVAPQVHLIFFFGFLLLFFLKKKYWSGIVLGLSFYTYPYTWTFLFAFLGCLAIINLIRKKPVKDILTTSLTALIISVPYFYNLWQAINHSGYKEVALRYGLINTHMPQMGMLVLLLLIIFLLFPHKQKNYDFFLAWVLAPVIVLNQQIITGRVLIPDHYHWYYHKPLIIIIFLIILFHYLKKKSFYYGAAGLIMAANFYNAGLTQIASYKQAEPIAIEQNQKYGPVLEWLNNNVPKDEVVAGDGTIADLIPMYTSLNSATNGDGHYSLVATEQQVMERIFLELRLAGLDDPEEVFFEKRAFLSSEIYGQRYRKQLGDYGNIPDQKIRWLIGRYKDFYALPLEYVLNKYQVGYIIWDIDEELNYPFLKQVYQDENVRVLFNNSRYRS